MTTVKIAAYLDVSRNGSGVNRTALTIVNIAALAPMPIASVTIATDEKPVDLRKQRTA